MGQPVYGRVTPDGYPDVSRGWLSNNDLLARFNFAGALLLNNIKGTKVDTDKIIPGDTSPPRAAAEVARIFLNGQASDQTRSALEKLAAEAGYGSERARVCTGSFANAAYEAGWYKLHAGSADRARSRFSRVPTEMIFG